MIDTLHDTNHFSPQRSTLQGTRIMILTNWLSRLWSDVCNMANRGGMRRGSRSRRRRSDISLLPAIELLEPRRLMSAVMDSADVFIASKNDEL